MNQELLDYLEAHQDDGNYASGNAFAYGLNNRLMGDLASGGVPAGLIAPGVSYSQRKPQGYTQNDLADPFGYVDQTAPYMPSGPRYMPMVSDASTFNDLAAQYGANQSSAYNSTVGGTTNPATNVAAPTAAPTPAPQNQTFVSDQPQYTSAEPDPVTTDNPTFVEQNTYPYVADTDNTTTSDATTSDTTTSDTTTFTEEEIAAQNAASLLFEQTGYRTEEEALANNYIKGVDGNYYYYNPDPVVLQEIRESDPYNTMYNDYTYDRGSSAFNNLDELF